MVVFFSPSTTPGPSVGDQSIFRQSGSVKSSGAATRAAARRPREARAESARDARATGAAALQSSSAGSSGARAGSAWLGAGCTSTKASEQAARRQRETRARGAWATRIAEQRRERRRGRHPVFGLCVGLRGLHRVSGDECHVQGLFSPGWPRRQRGILSALTRHPPPLRHLVAAPQQPAPQFGLSGRVNAPPRLPRSLRNAPQSAHSLQRNSRVGLCEDTDGTPQGC